MNDLEQKLLNKILEQVQFTDLGSWFLDICESDFDFISECDADELPDNMNYLMRKCLRNKRNR